MSEKDTVDSKEKFKKEVNPALFNLCGAIGGMAVGIPILYLVCTLLGIDLWEWRHREVWETSLLFCIMAFSWLIGTNLGYFLGTKIRIKSEKVHHIVNVIINYTCYGFLRWTSIVLFNYVGRTFGKDRAVVFVNFYGSKKIFLEIVCVSLVGHFVIACILLLAGKTQNNSKKNLFIRVILSLPVTLAMAYIQFQPIDGHSKAWIIIGGLYSIFITIFNSTKIEGDKKLRSARSDNFWHFVLRMLFSQRGRTFLMGAAYVGDTKKVEFLIRELDSRVNARDDFGATALILASRNGFLDIVKLLVEHEASIDQKDNSGKTALEHAKENNHTHVIEFLQSVDKKIETHT